MLLGASNRTAGNFFTAEELPACLYFPDLLPDLPQRGPLLPGLRLLDLLLPGLPDSPQAGLQSAFH